MTRISFEVTYPDFRIKSFLQSIKLLIVGIIVNSLAFKSVGFGGEDPASAYLE